MKIERETSVYNERRYGKPWIAKVEFNDSKGTFIFGDWVGDARSGSEGILVLDNIEPGEIFARGQKDFRKPRNSSPDFYILRPDGTGELIASKAAAYKHYRQLIETSTTSIGEQK